jgi:predicted transcriptional regulator
MRTAEWSESVSVLDRITAVFDAFEQGDDGLGVTELACRANLPKSTVSRLAAELVEQGFLERHGDKLFLGARLYELGQNVAEPRRLRRLALPIMAEVRDLTGCTVTLALVRDAEVITIAVARGRDAPTRLGGIGMRAPAAQSALGRAVLAASRGEAESRVPPVVVVANEDGSGLTHLATAVVCHADPVAALSLCAPDDAADVSGLTSVLRRASGALGRRATHGA